MIQLLTGDCLDHLRQMPSCSVDAVVTDPPYGLSAPPDIAVVLAAWMAGERYEHRGGGFMSADWDSFVPQPQVFREILRVLKPGGHAAVFASARTSDLMGISVRLAGFEVRDVIHWCYWSGFPKSLDVSRAIDALHGAEREVVGARMSAGGRSGQTASVGQSLIDAGRKIAITAPATEDAKRWQGHGTAVKPAIEPALLLRKPISESSIARNVLKWGTGSLNIDACRFAPGDPMWPGPDDGVWSADYPSGGNHSGEVFSMPGAQRNPQNALGRFPSNLVYVAKANRRERELGCEGLPTRTGAEATGSKEGQARLESPRTGAGRSADAIRNWHPTVKPLKLMRWLVRLVTPPGGVVLDPFMGSGTTGMAVVGQGFGGFIGCELLPEHMQIARARIEYAASGQAVDCDLPDVREPAEQVSMFGRGK